jgi:hypothetical protein
MNWFDILKRRKGRHFSKKRLDFLRDCLNELEGVEVDNIKVTKKEHFQFYSTYTGKEGIVKFIVSTGMPDKHISMAQACQGMRTNARRALNKKNIFISEW